jgi:hypothetical protein
MADIVPQVSIETKIFVIRGEKIMLDRDLAELYGVETRALNQAVKRNADRFPADFMFTLSRDEILSISQSVISLKFARNVNAFTEQGVAMLSGILNSSRAIAVNIQIMRAFVRLRKIITENKDILKAIQNIERHLKTHDRQIQIAFATLQSLLTPPPPEITKKPYSPDGKKQMGFVKEKKP